MRWPRVLLTGILFLLVADILMICFTGGYHITVEGITVKRDELTLPIIFLLVSLVSMRSFNRHGFGFELLSNQRLLLIFSLFLIGYLINGKLIGSGDTVPARYLPLSVLREGDFDLDEFRFLYSPDALLPHDPIRHFVIPPKEASPPYYLQNMNGHYVSIYPVGSAILALPFYLLSALGTVNVQSLVIVELEKVSAASIVALSAMVLYAALRLLIGERIALLATIAYGFGSSSLSASSQALWQHGGSQLALAGSLYCLIRARKDSRWAACAGFPLGFALICRPSDIGIVLPLVLYVLIYYRHAIWPFLISGLPPALFQILYNIIYFSHPLRSQYPLSDGSRWNMSVWDSFTGLLFSPARGLFIYSPIFLFSLIGIVLVWKKHGDPFYRYISVGIALEIFLLSMWKGWWGGFCYGPRLLADLTPALAIFFCPLKDWLLNSRTSRVLFTWLLIWSISAHAMGAFVDDGTWTATRQVKGFPNQLWSWSDNQLINPIRSGLNQIFIARSGYPTSRSAPELLAASYTSDLTGHLTTPTSSRIRFSLEALNTGKPVWLATTSDSKGAVRLGWRWLKDRAVIMEGRIGLANELFHGESCRFEVLVKSPSESGTYILEVGLVSELVVWFSDLGTPSVRTEVAVID